MIEEIKVKIRKCDACDVELKEPLYHTNDGVDRREYFSDKDIDLCFKCSAKLLKKLEVSEDIYKEMIQEIKKDNNFNKPLYDIGFNGMDKFI